MSVTLTFGVGGRDEILPTAGTLHALEHLVMDTGAEDADHRQCRGGFERHGVHRGGIASAGGDLPRGCLPRPRRSVGGKARDGAAVLEAEGADGLGADMLLVTRFGWRDLGLFGAPGPGPRGIRTEVVRDLART